MFTCAGEASPARSLWPVVALVCTQHSARQGVVEGLAAQAYMGPQIECSLCAGAVIVSVSDRGEGSYTCE